MTIVTFAQGELGTVVFSFSLSLLLLCDNVPLVWPRAWVAVERGRPLLTLTADI